MQFRHSVAQFAKKEVEPRAAEIDKSNTFPMVRTDVIYVVHQVAELL